MFITLRGKAICYGTKIKQLFLEKTLEKTDLNLKNLLVFISHHKTLYGLKSVSPSRT